MMKKRWKDDGMLSLLDAMLFFVIMLITSGLFLQIGITMSESAELIRDQQSAEYNNYARLAWMSSSIPLVMYNDALGIPHIRNNLSVQYLIMEELHLIKDEGIKPENIHFNERIQEQANLIIEPIYEWAFWAESGNVKLSMNRTSINTEPDFEDFKGNLGYEVHASSWNTLAFGGDGEVKMHFYTW